MSRITLLAFYDGDVDTDLYAKDFVTAYNAGLNGKVRPTENYISVGKAVAAYFAGQNDAKTASNSLNLRQENHIMSKNDAGSEYIGPAGEENGLRKGTGEDPENHVQEADAIGRSRIGEDQKGAYRQTENVSGTTRNNRVAKR